MTLEQGLSFTIIDAPHPLATNPTSGGVRQGFRSAHRVWLGSTAGTDWLHEAVELDFGRAAQWYAVESGRKSMHTGAAGEVATIVVTLMGIGLLDFLRSFYGGFAQRLGELSADELLEWARHHAREHRKQKSLESADGPPNFFDREVDGLARGMRGELAEVLELPEEELEIVSAVRDDASALRAIYRDRDSGSEYEVIVGEDSATFTPL